MNTIENKYLAAERLQQFIFDGKKGVELGKNSDKYTDYTYNLNKSKKVKRFEIRESEKSHKVRINVTELIDADIVSTIKTPFQKIFNSKSSIQFSQEVSEDVRIMILENINEKIENSSIYSWFRNNLADQNNIDPDSIVFYLVDKESEDEIGYVVPFIVNGKDVIDYELSNGLYSYITFKMTYKGLNLIVSQDKNYTIIYDIDKKSYIQNISDSNSKNIFECVCAMPLGYLLDKSKKTKKDKCYLPLYYQAIVYIDKMAKAMSEMDITAAYIAFNKTIQYVPPCGGYHYYNEENKKMYDPCSEGKCNRTGENCKACGGTGKKIINSALDAIEIDMPQNKQDIVDLSNIIRTISPDVSIIEWQEKYVYKTLKDSSIKAVFNTEYYNTSKLNGTATSAIIDQTNTLDVVRDFADHYERHVNFFLKLLLKFHSVKNGKAKFTIDKTLIVRSQKEIIEDIRNVTSSGASIGARREMLNILTSQLFDENPNELKRALTINQLDPLFGWNDLEIQSANINNAISKQDLFNHYSINSIIKAIETEYPLFYDSDLEFKKKVFKDKSDEFYVAQLDLSSLLINSQVNESVL